MAGSKSPGGKEVGRISVRVVANFSKLRPEVLAELKKIEKGLRLTVTVDVDTRRVTAAAAQVRSTLESVSFSKIDLDLGPTETVIGNVVASLSNMLTRLREISRSVVDVTKRTVNLRNHFARVGTTLSSIPKHLRAIREDGLYNNFLRVGDAAFRLKDRVANAMRTVGRASSNAFKGLKSGLSGMTGALGSAVSGFTSLGRTGLIVVGVLLLIAPLISLVAGLIAGLPSLLFAFGAAFAAVALGMDGIKKAAAGLGPKVDQLKARLSATFEAGLTPVFQQLGTIFPVLEKGLVNVAKGLIPLAAAFVSVVTSAQGLTLVQSILDNTGTFFAALAPMVRDFVTAFLLLADAGAKSFGVLAGVLNGFAAQFLAVTQRITSDGSFASAMQGLAAVTGSLLSLFNRLFESGVRVLGSLGGPLATLIDGVADALVALMPILGVISGLVATVLGKALSALAPVVSALQPALSLLGSMLGELLVGAIQALIPVLMPLANILNTVVLMALKAIQPILPPLIKFLTQLGETIGNALVSVFGLLTPLLELVAQFLTQLLVAVTPLLPALNQLATAVLTALVAILTPLMPLLMQLAELVFPALISVIQLLVPALVVVIGVLAEIVGMVGKIVAAIVTALMPIFEALFQVVADVWPRIEQIIRGALNIITGVLNVVLGLITGDWRRAWEGIKQIVLGAWDVIKGAVLGTIQSVISIFAELPWGILRALGNLAGLLWDAGRAIVMGLFNGIKASIGAVYDYVSGIASKIASLKGPLSYDRRLLIPAGAAIMQGLHRGLRTNFVPVMRLVSGMGAQLAGSLASSDIGGQWAAGIEESAPRALRALDGVLGSADLSATSELRAQVTADDFGSVGDKVAEALAGWSVEIDANGLARLVNKKNRTNARR